MSTLTTFEAEFYEIINDLINTLQNTEKIQSSNDVKIIEDNLEKFLKFCPGPVTSQKLTGIDDDHDLINWFDFAKNQYTNILNILLNKINNYWPINEQYESKNFIKLLHINRNYIFIYENLSFLIKCCNLNSKYVEILKELLKSDDFLTSALIDHSRIYIDDEFNNAWKNEIEDKFIQILISIPTKISNLFHGKIDNNNDIFLMKNYGHLLLINLMRTICFIVESQNVYNKRIFDEKFLSKLFGRIICNFHKDIENELQLLMRIFFNLCKSKFSYKSTINKIIQLLNRNSIMPIIFAILKEDLPLKMIINDVILKSDDWNYYLTIKLPLMNIIKNDEMIIRFIEYLNEISNNENNFLKKLIIDLLNIWSNRNSIRKCSIEQLSFITKLAIVSIQHLNQNENLKLTETNRENIKKKLYDGITCYLESPNLIFRNIGQITIEIILGIIENDPNIEKLKFDYSDLNANEKEQINSYKEILEKCKCNKENEASTEINENLENLIEMFLNQTNNLNNSKILLETKQKIIETSKQKNENEKINTVATNTVKIKNKNDDDLDSDDDLISYDMSNDTPIEFEKRPKFLLDLKDYFTQTTTDSDLNDPELFTVYLDSAINLIRTQLPNNDVILAIELLNIFLNLDKKFYYENFDELKIQICVEICQIYPDECAKFLCKEFHSDDRKYSISTRIMMLDILAKSAKKLSEISKSTNEIQNLSKNSNNINNTKIIKKFKFSEEKDHLLEAKKIINERLKQKTKRYFPITNSVKNKNQKFDIQKNRFSSVAGSFFFPLIRGSKRQQIIYIKNDKFQFDIDSILIVTFINTLSIIILSSQNCSILNQMIKEIFEFYQFLRFNTESKIRYAIIQLIATVLIVTPTFILKNEFFNEIIEIKNWLEECLKHPSLGGEKNEECLEISSQVLSICYEIISANTE